MGTYNNRFTEQDVKDKIELCKLVHNNKYSYDKVVYVNYDTNVIITCPIHGDFEQNLYSHSKGNGCRKCRSVTMSKKMRKGKEDFVNKSNVVHNNKYSYDKVPDTFRIRGKVIITCPVHGDFPQVADSHKRGCGCPYCAGKSGVNKDKGHEIRKKRLEGKLLKDFNGKVKLINLPKKVEGKEIILNCDIHGRVVKSKLDISRGRFCGECLKTINRKNFLSNELDKMLKHHNNKFEYLDYNHLSMGNRRVGKLTIRCKEHNHIFKQAKSDHLRSKYGGCELCIKQYKNTRLKEQEILLEQFKLVHGDLYGYDNVIYENSEKKVWITCKKHGDFAQTPNSHLSGSGCPKCKHSAGEKLIQNLLKKMDINYITQKTFYGCLNDKTNKHLPFDVYVPEFHTCIEFDGYQHFIPIENWGGEETLREVQYRDQIKTKYCEVNEINLLRIPYTLSRNEIVDILNKQFNKNISIEIKKRTIWIDINIRERAKKYKTRNEFRKKDCTLYNYCRRNNLLDDVCEHMKPVIRHSYESAKEICNRYNDYTLFEKEYPGIRSFIGKNKYFDLLKHMKKRKINRSDEEILNELKNYKYKMDVRDNDPGLYSVALKRGLIKILKDKTTWWTEQMVRDAFNKCRTKKEVEKKYRGAENYAKKHGLYEELSKDFVKK